MRVRAEQRRAFGANRFVAKRCALGGAANDSDVLGHGTGAWLVDSLGGHNQN
jgi:hypothetical protein